MLHVCKVLLHIWTYSSLTTTLWNINLGSYVMDEKCEVWTQICGVAGKWPARLPSLLAMKCQSYLYQKYFWFTEIVSSSNWPVGLPKHLVVDSGTKCEIKNTQEKIKVPTHCMARFLEWWFVMIALSKAFHPIISFSLYLERNAEQLIILTITSSQINIMLKPLFYWFVCFLCQNLGNSHFLI